MNRKQFPRKWRARVTALWWLTSSRLGFLLPSQYHLLLPPVSHQTTTPAPIPNLNSIGIVKGRTNRPLDPNHTQDLRLRQQSQEDLVRKPRVLHDDIVPCRRDDTVVHERRDVGHRALDERLLDLGAGVLVEDPQRPLLEVDEALAHDEVAEAGPELLERLGAECPDLEVVGDDGRHQEVRLLTAVEVVRVEELEQHLDVLLRQVAVAEVDGLGLCLLGVVGFLSVNRFSFCTYIKMCWIGTDWKYHEFALEAPHEELGLLANNPSVDAPGLVAHDDGGISKFLITPEPGKSQQN